MHPLVHTLIPRKIYKIKNSKLKTQKTVKNKTIHIGQHPNPNPHHPKIQNATLQKTKTTTNKKETPTNKHNRSEEKPQRETTRGNTEQRGTAREDRMTDGGDEKLTSRGAPRRRHRRCRAGGCPYPRGCPRTPLRGMREDDGDRGAADLAMAKKLREHRYRSKQQRSSLSLAATTHQHAVLCGRSPSCTCGWRG